MGQSWHILNNESCGMFFQYQKHAWSLRKGKIGCNDPAARTLVTARKMKPADLSQALQITRLSPGSSIPSVQHQHLWPYSTKQLHTLQCNICEASVPFTATAHGLESSPLKQTPSPPGTSHQFRNINLMQPGASLILVFNQLFNRNVTSATQKVSN